MLRHFRIYRIACAGVAIVGAVFRYLWLGARDRIPMLRPSGAAWSRAHRNTGRSLYWLATHLGGAFVKLGQVIGARADFFPAAFLEPLRGLHDRVPARPFSQLRRQVERELGRPIAEAFAEISETPIAAASLAQVHRARLMGGEDVAVKVQYPEAQRLFPVDLGSMRVAVRVVRWLNRDLDLRPIADELHQFVCLELDFEREADSTERIRAALAESSQGRVRVPRVFRAVSSQRLLVLEFLPGRAISDTEGLLADGHRLPELAERVASLYCWMIFEVGFFHGDPHPGNLLVDDAGVISVLDFGLAKELPPGFARGVAVMLACGMSGDAGGALAAARSIGFVVAGVAPDRLVELVRALLGDYSGGSMRQALQGASLEAVPSHFALIGRVLLLLNGLSHRLAPGERLIARALVRTMAPLIAGQAEQSRAAAGS